MSPIDSSVRGNPSADISAALPPPAAGSQAGLPPLSPTKGPRRPPGLSRDQRQHKKRWRMEGDAFAFHRQEEEAPQTLSSQAATTAGPGATAPPSPERRRTARCHEEPEGNGFSGPTLLSAGAQSSAARSSALQGGSRSWCSHSTQLPSLGLSKRGHGGSPKRTTVLQTTA